MYVAANVDSLIVTQDGLRDRGQLAAMVAFLKLGGRFTPDARKAFAVMAGRACTRPMHIALLEDGRKFLHDGHHRAVAKYLAGDPHVYADECEVVRYTYRDYAEANLARGWYTPFDLATETRLADIGGFKMAVGVLLRSPNFSEAAVLDYINRKWFHYSCPRTAWTVADLARRGGPEIARRAA